MKRSVFAVVSVVLLASNPAFALPSVEPSVADAPWTQGFWLARFDEKRALAREGGYDVVFLGDSITHFWETSGSNVWAKTFADGPYRALDCGISGDRTEHLLWRIEHDQLGGLQPKAIVMMIGTNNTGHREAWQESPTDTILGIQLLLERIKGRFPYSKIILHPIFPCGATTNDPLRVRNDLVNSVICRFADGKRVLWCDLNARLLTADGTLEKSMAPDLLHPAEHGYEIWAEELKPYLDFALGRREKAPVAANRPAPTALETGLPKSVTPTIAWNWLTNESRRLRKKRIEESADTERYYDAIWLGDSITHFWEEWWTDGPRVFKERFGCFKVFNGAYGGDKTENALWNIRYGGVLDGVRTRIVSLMIGCNNVWRDTPEDIALGIGACVQAIREKQPQAKVLLFALLPREVAHERNGHNYRRDSKVADEVMPKIRRVNELIRSYADGTNVILVDLTERFTDAEGLPDIRLLVDGTHPNAAGYEAMADVLLPIYRKILGAR